MTCSQYLIHRVRNGTPPQRNAFFLRSTSTFQQKIPIFATQVPHVPSGSIAKERTNRKYVRHRLEGEVSPSALKQLTDKHRKNLRHNNVASGNGTQQRCDTDKNNRDMKLAEALSIRKDLTKKIEIIKSRLISNVRLQEGDEPSEQPAELFKELDSCLVQLESLIARINKTNMHTKADGRTLTEMMAEKEVLTKRIAIIADVADKANETQDRYSRSEIKMVTTIDVKALNKQMDKLSERLRKLDISIQGLNFLTDLED